MIGQHVTRDAPFSRFSISGIPEGVRSRHPRGEAGHAAKGVAGAERRARDAGEGDSSGAPALTGPARIALDIPVAELGALCVLS